MKLKGKNIEGGTAARAHFKERMHDAAALFKRYFLGIEPPVPKPVEPPKSPRQILDGRLFDAAKEGKIELAEHLISQGADPRAMMGWITVVNWALQFGKLEFAEWMADHGSVGRLDIATYKLSHRIESKF